VEVFSLDFRLGPFTRTGPGGLEGKSLETVDCYKGVEGSAIRDSGALSEHRGGRRGGGGEKKRGERQEPTTRCLKRHFFPSADIPKGE